MGVVPSSYPPLLLLLLMAPPMRLVAATPAAKPAPAEMRSVPGRKSFVFLSVWGEGRGRTPAKTLIMIILIILSSLPT